VLFFFLQQTLEMNTILSLLYYRNEFKLLSIAFEALSLSLSHTHTHTQCFNYTVHHTRLFVISPINIPENIICSRNKLFDTCHSSFSLQRSSTLSPVYSYLQLKDSVVQ
jgi:hypothetical protein